MESFVSINRAKKILSDRLFYDQYRWGLDFLLPGAEHLRGIKTIEVPDLAHQITRRHQSQTDHRRMYNRLPKKVDLVHLIDIAQWLRENIDSMKLVVTSNWAYVYTNDDELIRVLIDRLKLKEGILLKECIVSRERNTIVLKNTDYCYRSYFRESWMKQNQVHAIKSYLESQDDIGLSRGMHNFLHHYEKHPGQSRHLLQRHYFFDHKSPATAQMLGLIAPNIIRQTMTLLINN